VDTINCSICSLRLVATVFSVPQSRLCRGSPDHVCNPDGLSIAHASPNTTGMVRTVTTRQSSVTTS
jgi:hypothetical protein